MKFTVTGQKLTVYGKPQLTADKSVQFVELEFIFSSEWDGYLSTAQFSQNNQTYNVLLDENNKGYLPNEITEGVLTLSVFGVKPGGPNRATSSTLNLTVVEAGYDDSAVTEVTEVTPDLYSQMLALVNYKKNDLAILLDSAQREGDRQSAESGRMSAEDLRLLAEDSRVSAERLRVTAEQGRAEAEAGRKEAEDDRVEAEAARAEAEAARANSWEALEPFLEGGWDGLALSVCGVRPVEGDVPLTGGDVPVSGGDPTAVAVILESKLDTNQALTNFELEEMLR